MDSAPFSSVAMNALRLYQTIDRALYAILVFELWRDPVESLQVVALWLWLEYLGCENATRKLLANAPLFLSQSAEEAIVCLNCIMDPTFIYTRESIDLPMTRTILQHELSLKFFHDCSLIAVREIGRIIKYDCLFSLRDIISEARNSNFAESSLRNRVILPSNSSQSPSSSSTVTPRPRIGGQTSGSNQTIPSNADEAEISSTNDVIIPLNAPRHNLPQNGTPINREQSSRSNQPMVPYNNANDADRSLRNEMNPYNAGRGILPDLIEVPYNGRRNARHSIETMNREFSDMRIERTLIPRTYPGMNEVPPEDRTMFVTFSRGYPVAEREVWHFFTSAFGDCIESFQMEEVKPYEQPLYALVVFVRASFIPLILDGEEKAKFNINGKHVWMRKYVPRRVPSWRSFRR